ncbi:amidohydrolase/deacetylase family metallohydrolase [Chelatococcus reniformis]|uniref:Dihydroorotase n=1 Tax=Chelatococcus reniformis TaxID=1494448 RepID=A0A916UTE0_9HYPH|nr:amidohydrolase/deacetylase family metallohydrolase [Chelatococcus reniformis]GGC86906.1 dihydroorotase [Chelatococcus reniformis]
MLDLILRGGRVIDPGQGLDGTLDVGFRDGKVAAVAPHLAEEARRTVDAAGLIVTPGMIDMHCHVYWGASAMSLDARRMAPLSGVTTMVDAGTAGPGNFLGFRHFVIEPSPVRILPFINISYPGIFAYSKAVMVGECGDMRLLDPRECVRVIDENRDLVVGIKVRVGKIAGGDSGAAPLDLAVEAAEETGLPVMTHLDDPPPSRREVFARLRPGDILTHCFKPFPNAPVRRDGDIFEEVLLARERGVLFDIGHGGFSFGFRVARAMIEKGFLPDIISSDVHALNVDGPVFDLMTTLSKFYCLGLGLPDIVRMVTTAPAVALRRPDLGSLKPGSVGEATLLSIDEGDFAYHDARSEVLRGGHRFRCRGLVTAGQFDRVDERPDHARS